MRLKLKTVQQNNSVFNFWVNACRYNGSGCIYPESAKYEEECSNIWKAWHKAGGRGKLPVMPPAIIECEKCKFADLELGKFDGKASLMVIRASAYGIIPVPLKGRKKVWLYNISPKMLNNAIKEISPEVEAIAISGSPGLIDFSFLEKFPKLKIVSLSWNNKAERLWDFIKTPEIEFLQLESFSRLSDISDLKNARNLRCLMISSGGCTNSLESLKNLSKLEYLQYSMSTGDKDIRPLMNITSLKYLDCHMLLFDIDSYAMFEARRPDVYINFFEGICYWENEDATYKGDFEVLAGKRPGFPDESENDAHKYDSVALVGKRQGFAYYGANDKIDKQRKKYLMLKEKYINEDYIPILKSSSVNSPIENWRESLSEGIDIHAEKDIDEIEKILTDYANRISSGVSKVQAKNILKEIIKKITSFNERTNFIETEEKQDIYDYLTMFFNKKWYDELEEILSGVDW